MSDNRYDDDYRDSYESFNKPDIMDKIGDSFSSVFSRRSRENEKADELLSEFSGSGKDDYELFVDERVERKKNKKQEKEVKKKGKKSKVKKPVSPLMRRIRNIVTYCSIVAVVLIVCVILSLTVLFKTQNYEVTGNTKYTEAELIETCGISENENIFLANKKSAENRLIKAYPYIEEVDVSFDIPDTITIDIVEAVPSYMVKVSDSKYLIASAQGRILEEAETTDGYSLPLFLGSELTSSVVGEYINYADETTLKVINEIGTVFADNGYTGITEIDATDTANITFTYDNRIKVKIGLPEDISYKVRTAMTIINEKLDLNGSKTTEGELDVSSCNNTKKSYFREQSLIDAQDSTTAENATEAVNNNDLDEDGYDDTTGELIEEPVEETQPQLSVEDWYLN